MNSPENTQKTDQSQSPRKNLCILKMYSPTPPLARKGSSPLKEMPQSMGLTLS